MELLKKIKKELVLRSILMIVAGITLLIYPEMTTNTIAYIIAVAFIVLGIINIVGYFRGEKSGSKSYKYGLVIGVLLIVFAALLSKLLISLIPVVLGIIVLISGLLKLQQAVELLQAKLDGWKPIMIFAAINIIVGCLAIFNPFKTANFLLRIVGAGLLFGGITDLISSGYVSSKLKKADKNIIDMK